MKLIHLGDLHLGKCVLEEPMLEEQRRFLEQVARTAADRQADAVVIAGDLYDRAVPRGSGWKCWMPFSSLHDAGIPVLAVPGTDSPSGWGLPAASWRASPLHIAGTYNGAVSASSWRTNTARSISTCCPSSAGDGARGLGGDPGHRQAVRAAWPACLGSPAHATCVAHHRDRRRACRRPANPRRPASGGSDQVDASAFDGFDYVALGHLHRAQPVGRGTVRYAGSPLKYSLSEVLHPKSYPLVTLGEKGQVAVELLPICPGGPASIRGTLEDLLGAAGEEGRDDYIWAVLTGPPVLDPAERLRTVYPHLLHVETATPRRRTCRHGRGR